MHAGVIDESAPHPPADVGFTRNIVQPAPRVQ
ncbi:hypothetical protein MAV3388_03655 [Mycobacterium avium subsp. hominissuis 3388]|nr:hypothetical protein O984_17045 [Mycobacterium avium 05-4293]KDP02318.1 hypothetical protein MAV3388_03655 [Mycobacterium avium subsp. hominissuis 3388]